MKSFWNWNSGQMGYTSIQKPAFNKKVFRKWRGLIKLLHFLLIFELPQYNFLGAYYLMTFRMYLWLRWCKNNRKGPRMSVTNLTIVGGFGVMSSLLSISKVNEIFWIILVRKTALGKLTHALSSSSNLSNKTNVPW